MQDHHADISAFQHLGRIACDQSKVYADAAKMAESAELQSELRRLAESRRPIIASVNEHIAAIGGEPVDHGTMTGATHDMVVKTRDTFGGGDKAAVQEVCKGEEEIEKQIDKNIRDASLSSETIGYLRNLRADLANERGRLQDWKTRLDA